MHRESVPENSGTLIEQGRELYLCYACKQNTAKVQVWESHCGGYEDVKYTCTNPACGKVWWMDGIDS